MPRIISTTETDAIEAAMKFNSGMEFSKAFEKGQYVSGNYDSENSYAGYVFPDGSASISVKTPNGYKERMLARIF